MNAHTRIFDDKPAARESVPLLLGIFGPSGGGKTFSALRVATGIQQVAGGDIGFIDTEARRALQYADMFRFRHLQFDPPFGPLDYMAALEHFVSKGVKTVIIDSMSHEHEGQGGLLSMHEAELDRITKGDASKRERMSMLAWQKPKSHRQQLINRILQMNANFIFCFRAKESSKPVNVDGKMQIVPQGFVPIAGDAYVYEMTTCALLLPGAKGVPTWRSENPGERMMIKTAEQFRWLYEREEALSENTGRLLAEWAKGDTPLDETAIDALVESGRRNAQEGTAALREWMADLTASDKAALKVRNVGLGAIAKAADEARA